MSSFNIVTNIVNGAGLQRDYLLLRGLLESYGHQVTGTMFNDANPTFRQHDVNIFLEVIRPEHMRFARRNWVMPNSEWWYPEWEPCLRGMELVLCKTPDAYAIWNAKVGQRAVYTGFESNDFYRPDVKRVPEFLHMAGKSETKNTAAVMAAWRNYNLPYKLTAVAFKPEIVKLCTGVPNVMHVERYTDEQVIQKMNECIFHIMPSKYEGFGHYIHEAIGCGGVVVTTDAAPMNQFGGIPKEVLIPVASVQPRLAARFNLVSADHIAQQVHRAARMTPERIAEIHTQGRAAFLTERNFFRNVFQSIAGAS